MNEEPANYACDNPKESFAFRFGKAVQEEQIKGLLNKKKSDSFTTLEYINWIDSRPREFPVPDIPLDQKVFNHRRALTAYGVVREVEPDVWGLLY